MTKSIGGFFAKRRWHYIRILIFFIGIGGYDMRIVTDKITQNCRYLNLLLLLRVDLNFTHIIFYWEKQWRRYWRDM